MITKRLVANVLITLVLLLASSRGAGAQSSQRVTPERSQSPPSDTQYYVAVKGGVSLGSYESGLNWYLIEQIQQHSNQSLVAFSGASAGSINSMLSAITLCSHLDENVHSNLLRSSWNIDISSLNRRNNEGSLFNRDNIFNKVKQDLAPYLLNPADFANQQIQPQPLPIEAANDDERSAVNGGSPCKIITTFSVTLMYPYQEKINNTDQTTGYQRFVIPVEVSTVNNRIAFKNVYLNQFNADNPELLPDYFIALPETPSGYIDSDIVLDAIKASSSFPVAFAPVELPFCISKKLGQRRCKPEYATTSLFSDGGLFDNAPIGVSVDIHELYQSESIDTDAQKRIVFIHPDNYRSDNVLAENSSAMASVKSHDHQPDRVGLWDYLLYLGSSFDTATSETYRETMEKIHSDEQRYHFRMSSRYHNLLADFHAHFGAFYSAHFRVHDYLIGVYDGAYLMSTYACEDSSEQSIRQCLQEQMIARIKTLTQPQQLSRSGVATPKIEADNQGYERDFLIYLYNNEFKASLPLTRDYYQNTYIALAQAFYTFSGRDAEPLTFNNYMNNLKGLARSQFKSKSLQEELFVDYPKWAAEHFKTSYDNLIVMQEQASECYNCEFRAENKALLTILRISEPIKDSWVKYSKTGTWPLNQELLDCCSGTLRVGFGAMENSVLFTAAARADSPFERITFDAAVTFNYLEADFQHDDYFTLGAGLSYHTGSLLIPLLSGGYEHSFEGRSVYKDSLAGVYLASGLINELITVKLVMRTDDIEDFGDIKTRDKVQLQAQFDLLQLIEMIF
ncbi:patatin-like phospholipase family protein [Thalassotalea mangrovi]|uniref:Patatin-like phospholipase family protein n=1 Tax=Thalassotalea mangrovi TaxID=2572245 RepID=A0A4U1B5Z0_9GAMM|nr:patatin-like phospholipase family protein [Thalassotalea mangrovi]TKB45740.1 patatin-like phospholipase family protein [Thalassotalea mangrovi]